MQTEVAVRGKTYDMVYIGIFAVLIAVCSWISIPAAVPFTLQTFGVFMAVEVLGGKRGTMAVLVYILMGAVGIPVFAGFQGGIGVIFNTTGGYIVGFLCSALIMWAAESLFGKKPLVRLAVCSWISIPAAVPFTLQTFGVFMAVEVLGGKRGTMAVLVYILMGAVGIPVFAGFQGGIGVIFNTTGGYIVGFLCSALIVWAAESLFGKKPLVRLLSMAAGLIACYALGTIWFMVVYGRTTGAVGLMTVLGWCVIPFIIPDLVKIGLAYVISRKIRGVMAGMGLQ